MNCSRLLAALSFVFFCAAPLSAVDLAQLEKKITKEPAYKSKPKYCLLVFGPEAKTRVWLALDGDVLYVDRNGNSDLTEEGEKVAANKRDDSDGYTFKVGDVRDGALLHKNLTVFVSLLANLREPDESIKAIVAKDSKACGCSLSQEVEMPGWKGVAGRVLHLAGADVNGMLQFADRPQDAPVVHFGGPWQVTCSNRHRLTAGRETDVVLRVGTPGNGPGATSFIGYDGVIPEKVYPTLEIVYPPKRPGDDPVRQRYEIRDRC
jgi:hypothetical protein